MCGGYRISRRAGVDCNRPKRLAGRAVHDPLHDDCADPLGGAVHLALPTGVRQAKGATLADDDLPVYSVLVPLHHECQIAPALVQALRSLDYPARKLEIFFITEAQDAGTRAALIAANQSEHMRIFTVPAGTPQTKPRALNYALQFARGDLVAVFDAEDVPSPRQLRLAAEMFAAGGPELVCVQARLGIYNPDDGFLTRQFALEYASLFEAILPALERLGLPILLGGTSNHFRRRALEALGAWDAYNVTEDADLGIRIARAGMRVAMLDLGHLGGSAKKRQRVVWAAHALAQGVDADVSGPYAPAG